MAVERLSVVLELITGNYKREAREAATATGQIGNSAKSVTGSIGAMLGPAAIGGAIVGLGRMALAAGENADRLFDLASQTGLSTDALQEWEFVAKAAGAGTEVFSDAVKAVIRNLNETEGATGAAGKAYETLGINTLDASGKLRDAGEITDEVFTKLAGMENITARNALAQDIFGKKWEETISILDLGTDALGAARDEAHELGAVISGESLQGADRFRESFEKLKTTLSAKFMEILGDLGPVLADVADETANIVEELEPLLDGLGWLVDRYSDLKDGLDNAKESENAFVEFLGKAGDMVFSFGGALGALFTAIEDVNSRGRVFADTASQMADAAKDDLAPALTAATGPATTLGTALKGVGDRAEAAADSIRGVRTAALELASPIFAAAAAADRLAGAQAELERVQDDSKSTTEDVAQAQLAFASALIEAQIAAEGLDPTNLNAGLDLIAKALKISKDEAALLLEQLGILDGKTVTTYINTVKTTRGDGSDVRSGARAFGGPVWGGQPYMVGERGPELFVPQRSGSIVSNDKLRGITKNGPTININNPTGVTQTDLQYAALLASVQTMVES